jgi:hypothetical protein
MGECVALFALIASAALICLTAAFNQKKAVSLAANNAAKAEGEE